MMFSDPVGDNAILAFASTRAFVESLDRSVLGRFASDKEHLIHILALARTEYKTAHKDDPVMPDSWEATDGLSRAIRNMITARLEEDGASELYEFIYAEARFWDDNIGIPYKSVPFLEKLDLIASHDDRFHDFYAMDIWDQDFIENCIANNMDAELALSMTKEAV